MKKFCYVCGKQTDHLFDGLCSDCFAKRITLVELPKKIEIIKCSKCPFVKFNNKWQTLNIEEIIKTKLKAHGDIKKTSVELKDKIATVHVSGSFKDISKEESHDVRIHFNKIMCPNCTRLFGGYYEAIIQLRGDFNQKTLSFIADSAERFAKDQFGFYRVKEVKEGLDLYFGSTSIANKIADALKPFKPEIKRSFKLVTRKDGKDIYRTVISVRFA